LVICYYLETWLLYLGYMSPKTARILKTIDELENYLAKLTKSQKYSLADFKQDWHIYYSVERLLQLSIESIIEIGEMVIGLAKLKKPEIYRETFDILAEAGIINLTLALKLQRLTEFRNKLVHAYSTLPLERIYQIYTKDFECIPKFVSSIRKFLTSHNV